MRLETVTRSAEEVTASRLFLGKTAFSMFRSAVVFAVLAGAIFGFSGVFGAPAIAASLASAVFMALGVKFHRQAKALQTVELVYRLSRESFTIEPYQNGVRQHSVQLAWNRVTSVDEHENGVEIKGSGGDSHLIPPQAFVETSQEEFITAARKAIATGFWSTDEDIAEPET